MQVVKYLYQSGICYRLRLEQSSRSGAELLIYHLFDAWLIRDIGLWIFARNSSPSADTLIVTNNATIFTITVIVTFTNI
ncbi:hypothetical protein [Nostoc sp.]